MLNKKYKPYKKKYKPNEKVYHLYMYNSWDGFFLLASLHCNTIRSSQQFYKYGGKSYYVMKYRKTAETVVSPEWIAPRTPEGKKFLQQRAHSIITAKLGSLKREFKKTKNKWKELTNNFK